MVVVLETSFILDTGNLRLFLGHSSQRFIGVSDHFKSLLLVPLVLSVYFQFLLSVLVSIFFILLSLYLIFFSCLTF